MIQKERKLQKNAKRRLTALVLCLSMALTLSGGISPFTAHAQNNWGGTGLAEVSYVPGENSFYALGNNLIVQAGADETKTNFYYADVSGVSSSAPIDLSALKTDIAGNTADGFELSGMELACTNNGTYQGDKDAFKGLDISVWMRGGTLSNITSGNINAQANSISVYMSGGVLLGENSSGSAITTHNIYISGGRIEKSLDSAAAIYISGSPEIGGNGHGIKLKSGNKFYLDGALSGADVYVVPQAEFADGTVIAEASGYTITENDLRQLHLTGDYADGRELYLENNSIKIRSVQETAYDIWVGGIQVTDSNAADVLKDGTVSYDAESSTLTLDSASISNVREAMINETSIAAAVMSYSDLNIALTKDSENTVLAASPAGGATITAGIIAVDGNSTDPADMFRNISITGGGNLNISVASENGGSHAMGAGIYGKDVNFSGGANIEIELGANNFDVGAAGANSISLRNASFSSVGGAQAINGVNSVNIGADSYVKTSAGLYGIFSYNNIVIDSSLSVMGSAAENDFDNLEEASVHDAGADGRYIAVSGAAAAHSVEITPAPEHSHPVCGDTDCTEHGSPVAYTKWDGSQALKDGNYYLDSDMTISNRIDITGTVRLCLNGHRITCSGDAFFNIREGANLKLCDCHGGGIISGSENYIFLSYGTTDIYGGIIHSDALYSAAVFSGSLNMYGGKIECTLSVIGADSFFNMYGGEIQGKNNGVYLSQNSTANISGGTISGDSIGILADDEGTVHISGSAVIKGLNIFGILSSGKDFLLYVSGGSVTGGSAGIWIEQGTLSLSGSPIISRTTPEAEPDIISQRSKIYAKDGNAVYSGDLLTITLPDAQNGDVIVYDVNNENAGKFALTDSSKQLDRNGNNLVLAARTCTITLPDGSSEGYSTITENGSTNPAAFGGSFSFRVEITQGYYKTDDFIVKANGEKLEPDTEGIYTLTDIRKDITVTVDGVAQDMTAPAGAIILNESIRWTTFLENITFDLFCQDAQTLSITAEDAETDINKIEYLVSSAPVHGNEIQTVSGWQIYSDTGIELASDGNYIVYAKLTDNSGNVSYISSEGIVIDSTVPTVQGIEDGKTYCGPLEFTAADDNLKHVTVDGIPITPKDNKYVVSPADGVQTVVVTDKANNSVTFKITVKDGHTLKYKKSGDSSISETCEVPGCTHEAAASLSTEDGVYAGVPVETGKVSYSTDWLGGELSITYKDNDKAGTAAASITKGGVTVSREFTVRKGSQTAPSDLRPSDETIDGRNDGSITGVSPQMEYRKDTETSYTPIVDGTITGLADGTYYVRYTENNNYAPSSDVKAVINKGRKLEVSFVADGTDVETIYLSWNESVNTLPEIPAKTGYDAVPPVWDKTLDELKNVQEDITVTAQYTLNRYTVPLENGEGYTLEAVSPGTVNHGERFTFRLVIADGYSRTDEFSVRYNGESISPNADGSYTVTVLTGSAGPVISGVADITAPEGDIVINGSSVKKPLSQISFRLFYNESVKVSITGQDGGSGLADIEYLRSDSVLTEDELQALPQSRWTKYSGPVTETAKDAEKFIYYVKITDKAGNTSLFGSDGAVFDLTSGTESGTVIKGESGSNTKGNNKTGSPSTGDVSNTSSWFALLLAAGVFSGAAFCARRRKDNK